MFTEEEKKKKNWRAAKRKLTKARNKRDKLMKKLANEKYAAKDLQSLREAITDAKVDVATLELRIGDKPE